MLYIYVYENYRLIDLPWNAAVTWYLAALLVDFGFYWVHRASHGNVWNSEMLTKVFLNGSNRLSQKSTFCGQSTRFTTAPMTTTWPSECDTQRPIRGFRG